MVDMIDRAKLSENTGSDAELAVEVINIFREQAEMWVRILDPKSDKTQWADAAHTIKGAALGIGATRLADVCKTAEQKGRGDEEVSIAEASLLIDDVRHTLNLTLDSVARVSYELSVSGKFRPAYDPV